MTDERDVSIQILATQQLLCKVNRIITHKWHRHTERGERSGCQHVGIIT